MRATSSKAHDGAVGLRAHDDVAELLGRLQPALRAHGEGHVLSGRTGAAPSWPAGLTALCCWTAFDEIGDRQPELGEQIRLHPDPHRVVGGAEDEDLADAGDAQQRVDDVDVGVVAEEQRVVRALGREQRDRHQRQAGRLPDRRAELIDLRRQVRLRLRQPVLDVHLVGVDVGVGVERDGQLHRAVVRVGRLHVQHVVDAVHLLLDRRRHRLFHRDRVGARIGRGDDDLRRHDVGETARAAGRAAETTPTMTVRIAITIATIGRLMKNFAT